MSHFFLTVLVRPENANNVEAEVERLLAPFQEGTEGDAVKPHLVFHDLEDEYRQKFANEEIEMIRCDDGKLAYSWDEQFRVRGGGYGSDTHAAPATLERVNVRHCDRYKSFGEYMEDYCGYTKDEKTGRYGYWENSNAKWDWWTIGGRYTGRIGNYAPEKDPANYQTCWMCNGTGSRPDANYGPEATWAREGNAIYPAIGSGCNACLGTGKQLKFASEFAEVGNIGPVSSLPDGFSCFAILTPEGEWIERGNMGWWAIVTDEKDADTWAAERKAVFSKFADCIAVAVDCHI